MPAKKKAKKAKQATKVKKAATPVRAKKTVKKAKASKKPRAGKPTAKAKGSTKGSRGRASSGELVEYGQQKRGLGPQSAGQSGDLQGISGALRAGSESAEELLEEGQTFEAEAVAGVEEAEDPDVSEVVTREFPEDDIPEEYREKD